MTVSVDITNSGDPSGDAVAQMYAHHLSSKIERPEKQLVGFQRVTVEAGQTKTVQISLPAGRLAYWDVKKRAFAVEREVVSLMLGDSSANLPLSTPIHVE